MGDEIMLEILDITPPVHEKLARWPGLEPTRLWSSESFEKGDHVNVTNASFCAHVGLHVDAPCHHVPDGVGIDRLSLAGFVGSALVLDLTHVEKAVQPKDLLPLDSADPFDILLLKTKNSTEKETWGESFDPDYIYLSPEASEDILRRGIKGVAIDCLSVEGYNVAGCPTHKVLLKDNKIAVIEGVDLRGIEPGRYFFVCLPVKLVGSDGSPARAILIRDSEGGFLQAWDKAAKKTA
jgi:arylformamidase